jgi:hypothetical protein
MNLTMTPTGRSERSRAHPCAFCGLPTVGRSYPMPNLEICDAQSHVLERQGAGPWPICSDCDLFVSAGDEPGLTGRVETLLSERSGRPLSVEEALHVKARHPAFFAHLPARP